MQYWEHSAYSKGVCHVVTYLEVIIFLYAVGVAIPDSPGFESRLRGSSTQASSLEVVDATLDLLTEICHHVTQNIDKALQQTLL